MRLLIAFALCAASMAQAQVAYGTPPNIQMSIPARNGRFACAVTENGIPATASVMLQQGNRIVATGSCARPLDVPAGTYVAVIALENTLDRPTTTRSVFIAPDQTAT